MHVAHKNSFVSLSHGITSFVHVTDGHISFEDQRSNGFEWKKSLWVQDFQTWKARLVKDPSSPQDDPHDKSDSIRTSLDQSIPLRPAFQNKDVSCRSFYKVCPYSDGCQVLWGLGIPGKLHLIPAHWRSIRQRGLEKHYQTELISIDFVQKVVSCFFIWGFQTSSLDGNRAAMRPFDSNQVWCPPNMRTLPIFLPTWFER